MGFGTPLLVGQKIETGSPRVFKSSDACLTFF